MDHVALRGCLQHRGDSQFILDEYTKKTYTYDDFYQAASAIAGFLRKLGLSKNSRLCIILDNSTELAKIYFGCLYAGITVVPINPSWTNDQVNFVLEDSQSEFVLTESKYIALLSKNTVKPILINRDPNLSNDINFYNFSEMETFPALNPNDYLMTDNQAIIIYTSGTTSRPKGVVHTLGNLVGNGNVFNDLMNVGPENRFYNLLPMTYLGGYYNLLLIPYLAKASVVLTRAFDAKTILGFWDKVIENKINTLWFVPTIIAILLKIDRSTIASTYCKNHILRAFVGTAPLPTTLKKEFENKYAISLLENYGLSETLFIAMQGVDTPHTGVGQVIKNVKVKIVNEHDQECAVAVEGEIIVETPFVMNEYVGQQHHFNKNNQTWFYTGDQGYLDQNNHLFITGRKKDLIIKGGINISPAAIEEVIYTCKEVEECAVVGVPHEVSGEEIVAVVKFKNKNNITNIKTHIAETCRSNLTTFQQPDAIVEVEDLPHTFTGKIQKSKLRAWLVHYKKDSPKNTMRSIALKQNTYFKPSQIVEQCNQAISITYNNWVYDLQRQNVDVTVLSLGEAFFDIPLFDFTSLPYPSLYHYSHSRGIPELRQILAQYFQEEYDVKFDPLHEMIITAGSKVAIYMVLLALINPGDEVIIHEPAWVSFPEQVKLCHGVPVSVPYHESVFDFEKYITNRTKVLIINNPNNPKGSVLSLDEIAHLYKLAEKYNLYILSDEAYSDFVANKEEFISIGNFDKELKFTIICNSISKNLGISGWRIGYVIANRQLINQILKLNQHLITCPATILEYYITENFYNILKVTKPQITTLLTKRQSVIEYIKKIGLSCLEGTATFYIFLSIAGSKLDSDTFCKKLLEDFRIGVVPGIGYGKSCDQFVRVSIGAEPLDKIFAALDKIKALILLTHELHHLTSQAEGLSAVGTV
ncbi:MAG: aminotransferase class I/II-fold pyridoxal phosphate-dependent enzyme [Gammaproteobacteria bacterium]|nr:aminotransferase class I/II-fold pyridoxal phosphate-dependent enzyme [Gammaproteobacteria bacterium]